jgi:hypothetical protein
VLADRRQAIYCVGKDGGPWGRFVRAWEEATGAIGNNCRDYHGGPKQYCNFKVTGPPRSVTPPKPDLTIASSRAVYNRVSDRWYVEATVNNIGTAASGAFVVTYTAPSGATRKTSSVPSLPPDGQQAHPRYYLADCETDEVVIKIDPTHTIAEANEANNQARVGGDR